MATGTEPKSLKIGRNVHHLTVWVRAVVSDDHPVHAADGDRDMEPVNR
jgi:hypothetical protein